MRGGGQYGISATPPSPGYCTDRYCTNVARGRAVSPEVAGHSHGSAPFPMLGQGKSVQPPDQPKQANRLLTGHFLLTAVNRRTPLFAGAYCTVIARHAGAGGDRGIEHVSDRGPHRTPHRRTPERTPEEASHGPTCLRTWRLEAPLALVTTPSEHAGRCPAASPTDNARYSTGVEGTLVIPSWFLPPRGDTLTRSALTNRANELSPSQRDVSSSAQSCRSVCQWGRWPPSFGV